MENSEAEMAQKLSHMAPTPDSLVDLTLSNLLQNTPLAFKSYVDDRLWSVGNKNSRRISAEKLGQIIEKFKLSGKISSKLEEQIKQGEKNNPDYFLFDYKNVNYFVHLFAERLMVSRFGANIPNIITFIYGILYYWHFRY